MITKSIKMCYYIVKLNKKYKTTYTFMIYKHLVHHKVGYGHS